MVVTIGKKTKRIISETKEKETERRLRRPGLIPINNLDIVQGINKANVESFA